LWSEETKGGERQRQKNGFWYFARPKRKGVSKRNLHFKERRGDRSYVMGVKSPVGRNGSKVTDEGQERWGQTADTARLHFRRYGGARGAIAIGEVGRRVMKSKLGKTKSNTGLKAKLKGTRCNARSEQGDKKKA